MAAGARARFPLYDVHWPVAVVRKGQRGGETVRVGLADGRIMPLTARKGGSLRSLKLHDVVLVRVNEGNSKNKNSSANAELRIRPQVQGAAVVLENKTGRILAIAGGFSYPLSQLNRATQSVRQPGSALKPLTYLAALQYGLQPNTYVRDEAITFAPINGSLREQDYWTPKNYDGGASGVITLRKALEHSKNLATVNLLDGGIDATPQLSLDRVCALSVEAQLYKECARYYPFVLGAQPVRPIDLAAFFADSERGHARRLYDRGIERRGRGGLPPRAIADADRIGGPGLILSAQNHDAGRVAAWNRACHCRHGALCGGQDRNDRRRKRCLVCWLLQRRHDCSVGWLR
jgi:hypothetical protein